VHPLCVLCMCALHPFAYPVGQIIKLFIHSIKSG
jgi:hypothetical protein